MEFSYSKKGTAWSYALQQMSVVPVSSFSVTGLKVVTASTVLQATKSAGNAKCPLTPTLPSISLSYPHNCLWHIQKRQAQGLLGTVQTLRYRKPFPQSACRRAEHPIPQPSVLPRECQAPHDPNVTLSADSPRACVSFSLWDYVEDEGNWISLLPLHTQRTIAQNYPYASETKRTDPLQKPGLICVDCLIMHAQMRA